MVIEPIKLHVQAKRYLCRYKLYHDLLSNLSKISLKLHGDIMSHEESQKFTSMKFCRDVISLRRYDDDSKKPINKIKKIDDYRDLIISQLLLEKDRKCAVTKAALF